MYNNLLKYWRKPPNYLNGVAVTLDLNKLYRERFELTTFVVIGTDCIGTQVVVNPTKIRYRPRRPPLLRDASYMFKATFILSQR